MSNSDLNRAVSFLQGAPDAATSSADAEKQSSASENAEPQPKPEAGPLLPGFEPSAADLPPANADAPFPEMDTLLPEPPIPVTHIRAKTVASLELHPPAKKRAALAAAAEQNVRDQKSKPDFRFSATVALAALSGVLGIALIVACVSLARTPAAEATSADIPLALLPETADASLWDIVAGMSGEINGVHLQFERGIASGNGISYRLQLDFCRNGADIYAKVSGDRMYVVRLDGQGKITKAYPAPKNNRPLKSIFGE